MSENQVYQHEHYVLADARRPGSDPVLAHPTSKLRLLTQSKFARARRRRTDISSAEIRCGDKPLSQAFGQKKIEDKAESSRLRSARANPEPNIAVFNPVQPPPRRVHGRVLASSTHVTLHEEAMHAPFSNESDTDPRLLVIVQALRINNAAAASETSVVLAPPKAFFGK